MPGFGNGAFGDAPFGEWDWSRQVFWTFLPEIYRSKDAENGGYLELWIESFRQLFDELRFGIRTLGEIRDPLRVRTQYDTVSTLRLGAVVTELGKLEQFGIDGQVLTDGALYASSARFTDQDRGKVLLVSRSTVVATNNATFIIAAVVGRNTLITDPAISVDPGPLRWEVRRTSSTTDTGFVVEVDQGDVSEIGPGNLLSDGNADYKVLARRQFREDQVLPLTLKSGSDGIINSSGNLVSARAPFALQDIGRRVTIVNSVPDSNNGVYLVSCYLSTTELVLLELDGSATALVEDPGAPDRMIAWSIRPKPLLTLEGAPEVGGLVEQQGVDLAIITASQVKSSTATFIPEDVGKRLSICGSTLGNSGTYVVATVLNQNELVLDTSSLVVESSLVWALRTVTKIGDLIQVQVRQRSLLSYLARDFGIEIDTQENEDRQRSWVRNVSQWVDLKGTAKAYELMGKVSGFEITAQALFKLSLDVSSGIPSDELVDVGEASAGRSGEDGSLFSGPPATFSSPTAAFVQSDVGRLIGILEAGTPANNKSFEIEAVLDEHTVSFRIVDGGSTDPSNGALVWKIFRLYTARRPTLPRYDEVRGDLLSNIVRTESLGALDFRVDKYCWEDDWSSAVAVTISNLSLVSLHRYQFDLASATSVAPFPEAPSVVSGVGRWKLIDSLGAEFWLEAVPTGGPPQYTTEVVATVPPAVGSATLRYVCSMTLSCGYCPASKVLLTILLGDIATEGGLAIEKAQERILTRLTNEVRPAHVQLVVRFQLELEARLNLSASVEPQGVGGLTLYAPLTALYDDIPGDDIPTDIALRATVDTP